MAITNESTVAVPIEAITNEQTVSAPVMTITNQDTLAPSADTPSHSATASIEQEPISGGPMHHCFDH